MSVLVPCVSAVWLLLAALPLPVAAESEALVPGEAVERPLAAEGVAVFEAELTAGKPWRVRVEQLGIDVVLAVRDPRGESLLTVAGPAGREEAESLLLIPAMSGTHRIEVRGAAKGAPDGRFLLRLDQLPDTTPEDRLRLRAEQALSEAGRLLAAPGEGAGEAILAALGTALDAWGRLGERREEARARVSLGGYFEQLGDAPAAAASYAKALALRRELEDRDGIAAVLDRLGSVHMKLGEHPRAVGELEESLALRRLLGRRERQAETRNLLGLAMQRSGRFREAARLYEDTLPLARELGDRDLEARLLNNLGGIFQNLGEPTREFDTFRKALELQRAIGSKLGEGAALNNLGAFHRRSGDLEAALRAYAEALTLFEHLDHRYWQARTLNNIGYAYLTLGEAERARAYLLRALPLRREVGDRSGESVTLLNLGRAFAELGENGRALAYFNKALEIGLATGDARSVTTARRRIGEMHMAEGESASARAEFELALAGLRETGQRLQEAEVEGLLSRVHLALGEAQRAESLAADAFDLHRATGNPLGEVVALTALARARRELRRPLEARAALELALDLLETLHGRLGDPAQRASFQASQREAYELYVEVLMELARRSPGAGYEAAALAASERGRSRALLGLLESVGAGLGGEVEPELRERLREAERHFAAKTRRRLEVLGGRHGTDDALAAEQELYTALNALDNVRAEIRRKSPRYASLERSETLDAAAVQALLDERTVLLEFFLGESRSYLWWVTPTSLTAHELPPRREIEALAGRTHTALGAVQGSRAAARRDLQELGRMLLGPVAQRLRDQRLVIVADGALHFVPFAALTLPTTRDVPVLSRHEVVYLPSASVLARQRELGASTERAAAQPTKTQPTKTQPTKTVAIFADPIFERQDPRLAESEGKNPQDGARSSLEPLDRLTHTRREAEAIAALLPVDQRLLALDGEARRSRVLGDQLAAYRILHFATHGLINSQAPELSGLMLSRFDAVGGELDGFLGLYDIANLELPAELVVLSGCRTALGKEVRGEGLIGLTRGFMYAGVPRVVASFWQVRDEATAELMGRFYRAMLVEKRSPAAALRAAQLELREQRRFRDPFYWAAFALQGDWRD